MYKKIAIAGATAAVILGAGTAALAASGGSSTSGSPAAAGSSTAPASGAHAGRKHRRIEAMIAHHGVHGTIVTENSKGEYVTHDGVLGAVTAVSPSSITVKASDGFTQTYTVNASTKVRQAKDVKAALTIGSVHVGDHVGVVGTGAPARPTATFVIEGAR